MTALTLIHDIHNKGCEIWLEGERIRIHKGNILSDELKEQLSYQREEIKRVLTQDKQAKAAGFMIGIPGELYTLSLDRFSNVYIEKIDNHWEGWRETYQKGGQLAVSTKTIVKSSPLEHTLQKMSGYLKFIQS